MVETDYRRIAPMPVPSRVKADGVVFCTVNATTKLNETQWQKNRGQTWVCKQFGGETVEAYSWGIGEQAQPAKINLWPAITHKQFLKQSWQAGWQA